MKIGLFKVAILSYVGFCILMSYLSIALHDDVGLLKVLNFFRYDTRTMNKIRIAYFALLFFSIFLMVLIMGLRSGGQCPKLNYGDVMKGFKYNPVAWYFFIQTIIAIFLSLVSILTIDMKFTLANNDIIRGLHEDFRGTVRTLFWLSKLFVICVSFVIGYKVLKLSSKGALSN